MEPSLFIAYIAKWFSGTILRAVEKTNDTTLGPTYLYKRFLTVNENVTGKWESLIGTFTRIMADVVSMDSSLPLKKRDSLSKASGDIPKMGIELKLNERQLTDIGTLQRQPNREIAVVKKIFADVERVIFAINERLEAIFLESLSTGICIIDDVENVGAGFRIDFGYLSANKFGTAVVWSTPATAKPFDDFDRMVGKATADGNTITTVLMDKTAFNNLVKTTQALDLFAFNLGYTGTLRTTPSLTQINSVLTDRYGFTVELVDRSVRYERNGVQTSFKPWATGAVVGLCSPQIGSLEHSILAEEDHPVTGVEYQKADEFMLISKFRTNRPSLAEFTTAQARVLPVLSNTDQIYLLDSTTVQA